MVWNPDFVEYKLGFKCRWVGLFIWCSRMLISTQIPCIQTIALITRVNMILSVYNLAIYSFTSFRIGRVNWVNLKTKYTFMITLILYQLFFMFALSYLFHFTCKDYNDRCPPPPVYDNAYYYFSGSTYVIYECNEGYQFEDNAQHVVQVCNQTNQWQGPTVDCTGKKFSDML